MTAGDLNQAVAAFKRRLAEFFGVDAADATCLGTDPPAASPSPASNGIRVLTNPRVFVNGEELAGVTQATFSDRYVTDKEVAAEEKRERKRRARLSKGGA